MKIRSAYDKAVRFMMIPEGETRTKRSMQAECDINVLMAQYEKTGLISHAQEYGGRYEDLPDAVDYQSALDGLIAADRAFDSLPAKLRARFVNEPANFLEFVQNPANRLEMIKLGLLKEEVDPAVVARKENEPEIPAPDPVP